jgi:hypothetical protein
MGVGQGSERGGGRGQGPRQQLYENKREILMLLYQMIGGKGSRASGSENRMGGRVKGTRAE